ncbi:MAG: cytochrome P460 family protein [Blastocatellia bacterium]
MNHSTYEDDAMPINKNARTPVPFAGRRKARLFALAAICLMTWSLFLWDKPGYRIEYPRGDRGARAAIYSPAPDKGYQVEYPQGYRNWTHVISSLIGPQSPFYEQSGGFHNFYANEKAMEGYRTGKFPDGSVIVDERNKAPEQYGVTRVGDRIGVAVMVKDSRRYAETGGWGYEVFRGENQPGILNSQVRATCYTCHAKQKERDFVFTTIRNP